uniref:Uncharacterized protein n=1 Tax=Chenopodium quinoa TaxID=63459 RepID=A0A803L610_CHEQI
MKFGNAHYTHQNVVVLASALLALKNAFPLFALTALTSSAFPFFRSARYSTVDEKPPPGKVVGKSSSFWSVIWWQKKPRREKVEAEMRRSKSVAVAGNNDVGVSKGKGWHFPSPMKVFRQSYSKTPKVVHERSPLHRG